MNNKKEPKTPISRQEMNRLCEQFINETYKGTGCPQILRTQLKDAFFAGAVNLLNVIIQDCSGHEEQANRNFQTVCNELNGYVDKRIEHAKKNRRPN